jgi:hypothetical protein
MVPQSDGEAIVAGRYAVVLEVKLPHSGVFDDRSRCYLSIVL